MTDKTICAKLTLIKGVKKMNPIKIRKKLESFLLEDVGDFDMTSESIFPSKQRGKGVFVAKDSGVIAGLELISELYRIINPEIIVEFYFHDGDNVHNGDVIAEVSGPIVHLLTGERVILNL